MIALLGSFLVSIKILPYLLTMITAGGMIKENWQKKAVPAVAGIVFPLLLSITLLLYLGRPEERLVLVYFLAIQGTAFLGLLDDVLGTTYPKGLINHFCYFIRQKKLSTGMLKAVGIGFLALWVVLLTGNGGMDFLLNWLLLVLAVNIINLLDLRPGRALKGTVFLFILPAVLQVPSSGLLFSCLGIICAYAPYDLQGQVMLGDTGANVLGMISGLLLLETPWSAKLIFLLLFVFLHLVAEKYSLTKLIEKSSFLRKIDQWGV